jgi:hypothetical protein
MRAPTTAAEEILGARDISFSWTDSGTVVSLPENGGRLLWSYRPQVLSDLKGGDDPGWTLSQALGEWYGSFFPDRRGELLGGAYALSKENPRRFKSFLDQVVKDWGFISAIKTSADSLNNTGRALIYGFLFGLLDQTIVRPMMTDVQEYKYTELNELAHFWENQNLSQDAKNITLVLYREKRKAIVNKIMSNSPSFDQTKLLVAYSDTSYVYEEPIKTLRAYVDGELTWIFVATPMEASVSFDSIGDSKQILFELARLFPNKADELENGFRAWLIQLRNESSDPVDFVAEVSAEVLQFKAEKDILLESLSPGGEENDWPSRVWGYRQDLKASAGRFLLAGQLAQERDKEREYLENLVGN